MIARNQRRILAILQDNGGSLSTVEIRDRFEFKYKRIAIGMLFAHIDALEALGDVTSEQRIGYPARNNRTYRQVTLTDKGRAKAAIALELEKASH